jgi:hypothetical protein
MYSLRAKWLLGKAIYQNRERVGAAKTPPNIYMPFMCDAPPAQHINSLCAAQPLLLVCVNVYDCPVIKLDVFAIAHKRLRTAFIVLTT